MNIIVSNKILKQIYPYTVLIQGTNTIFIDQVPTLHVFGKVHSVLASKFSAVYSVV
jgi:hypothetical protein